MAMRSVVTTTMTIQTVSCMKEVAGLHTTRNPKDPHDAYYRRVDINETGFHLFQNNSDNGQNHDSHIQLVPSTKLNNKFVHIFKFWQINKQWQLMHIQKSYVCDRDYISKKLIPFCFVSFFVYSLLFHFDRIWLGRLSITQVNVAIFSCTRTQCTIVSCRLRL